MDFFRALGVIPDPSKPVLNEADGQLSQIADGPGSSLEIGKALPEEPSYHDDKQISIHTEHSEQMGRGVQESVVQHQPSEAAERSIITAEQYGARRLTRFENYPRQSSESPRRTRNEPALVNESLRDWTLEPEESLGQKDRNDAHSKFVTDFKDLDVQRAFVAGDRLKLREKRRSLKIARDTLQESENQKLQQVRNFLYQLNLGDLLADLEELQAERDLLCDAEREYDDHEEILSRDEWQLRHAEKALYSRLIGTPENGYVDERLEASILSVESQGSMSSTLGDPSAAIDSWLSNLRHRNALRMQFEALRSEYENALQKRVSNENALFSFDEDNIPSSLENLRRRLEDVRQELAETEEDILKLREIISDRADLFFCSHQFPDVPSTTSLDLDEDDGDAMALPATTQELDSVLRPFVSRALNDSLLLPEDDFNPTFHDIGSVEVDQITASKLFINAWFLNRLRSSTGEILLFRSIYEQKWCATSWEISRTFIIERWSKDKAFEDFDRRQEEMASLSYYDIVATVRNVTRTELSRENSEILALRRSAAAKPRSRSFTVVVQQRSPPRNGRRWFSQGSHFATGFRSH